MTKNEERINKLFKELVPETGKADSLAGELVRAMSRIGYRFYNDGDQLGIGYGKETCNPAGRFLGVKGNDKIAKLTADAWAVYSEEAYEKVLDILCGAVADYQERTLKKGRAPSGAFARSGGFLQCGNTHKSDKKRCV